MASRWIWIERSKIKASSNVEVNVLNGHVRRSNDIEKRKNLIEHALSRIPQYGGSQIIDQDNNSLVTIYRQKLALHESIIRNISKAALFVGDWYGSAFMRSLTYSSKDFFHLTAFTGGLWPESLLVMIITVYLRYEESIVFMMIKDHQKHDFGDEKTGIEEEEYEENFTKYSGLNPPNCLQVMQKTMWKARLM